MHTPRGEVCPKHKAIKTEEIRQTTNFFLKFYLIFSYRRNTKLLQYNFLCLVRSAHFATVPYSYIVTIPKTSSIDETKISTINIGAIYFTIMVSNVRFFALSETSISSVIALIFIT